MRTAPLRFSVNLLLLALSLASAVGCGNNSRACPLSNSGCGCGLTQAAVCHGPTPQEFLFASGDAGKVLSMPINVTNGALGTAASVDGPQMSFGLTAGVSSSGTGLLYASDFRNAEIDGYSINLSSGLLSPLAASPFSTGTLSDAGGLSLSPQANFIYAADAGKIDAFAVDAITGLLTAMQGSPFTSGTSLQLLVDPTGRFLYAADDDPSNGVFAFTIDSTGALTPIVGSPFPIPARPFSIASRLASPQLLAESFFTSRLPVPIRSLATQSIKPPERSPTPPAHPSTPATNRPLLPWQTILFMPSIATIKPSLPIPSMRQLERCPRLRAHLSQSMPRQDWP
jgi:hypothetical protein